MAVIQLQDTALFSVAADLYNRKIPEIKLPVCWRNLPEEVSELVHVIYPQLPSSIETSIQKTISLIGSELANMTKAFHDIYSLIHEDFKGFSFSKVHWTSYFTINRMKTICAISEGSVVMDDITYPPWIEKYWLNLSETERLEAHNYFGKYSLYIFFHWVCYSHHRYFFFRDSIFERHRVGHRVERNRREFQILFHLARYQDLYVDNTAVENVFRYSVIMSDLSSVTRFFPLLPESVQRKNASAMATLIIRRYDSIGHVDVTKTEIVSTFLHLWQHLHHDDKINIVQTYFTRFFEFLLSFPGTEPLVYSVKWYRPSPSRKANREFLEKAAAEISPDCNEYDKYRKVFHLLFRKVEMLLCEIDVVSLLEKLLSVKDINSSVLMMKAMDVSKKRRILDVLHKIWQDLWKESIDVETFMTFFIEVQSEMIQEDAVNYN